MEQILFNNNMSYTLPSPASVVTNKVYKRQPFQQRKYASEATMLCTWNTGNDMIDTANSSLVLKVRTMKSPESGNYATSFGTGSCMNLVRNLRINHRSGTSYTNVQKLNLYRKMYDRYTHSPHWFKTIGAMMGYSEGTSLFQDQTTSEGLDLDFEYFTAVIPLHNFHSFFEGLGSKFLPSIVAAGLRVEIDLESMKNAFLSESTGSAPEDYEISDCYFNLSTVSLMDSAMSSLNTVAQKQSLEYMYKDIFTSQNSHPSNTSHINIDVNKSVSLCDSAICIVQDTTKIGSVVLDNFKSQYDTDAKWNYTLGSLSYPQVKIDDYKLAYMTALNTFDKLRLTNEETSVTPSEFVIGGSAIYSQTFERDVSMALSQSAINSSRSMRFELSYDDAPPNSQLITMYMTYLTSARSTLLNSKVDI